MSSCNSILHTTGCYHECNDLNGFKIKAIIKVTAEFFLLCFPPAFMEKKSHRKYRIKTASHSPTILSPPPPFPHYTKSIWYPFKAVSRDWVILYKVKLVGNTMEWIKAEISVANYKCLDIFSFQMNAWKYNTLYFNVYLFQTQYFFQQTNAKFWVQTKTGLNHQPSKQFLKQCTQVIICKHFNALSQQALTVFSQ